jgi:hypothetical protein
MRRVYLLTEAGSRAWESPRSGLPAHYRQILGLIQTETDAEEIHVGMRSHSQRQINDWLDELDTLGFVALVPGEPRRRQRRASR